VFMTDLASHKYADKWAVPVRTVGWLEYPHPYATGTVPPQLVGKLSALLENPTVLTFGLHSCSLGESKRPGCPLPGSAGPLWSREVFIPGDAEVFVAPGGIVHYIESHLYLPPISFIDAVMNCPNSDSAAYWAALVKSNAGIEPVLGGPPNNRWRGP
jgi:hypothetical protein